MHATSAKRGKKCATEWRSLLVLHLNGWCGASKEREQSKMTSLLRSTIKNSSTCISIWAVLSFLTERNLE